MNKRLVFHTASLLGGGAERVFVLMANALAERGHDVTLLTWNAQGPNRQMVSPKVKLHDLELPITNGGYGKAGTLRGLRGAARALREIEPDAVYSAPEFMNLLTALALQLAGSKARFFPSFHAAAALKPQGLGTRLAVHASRLVAQRATKAIAVSDGVGRELVERGFARPKVLTIHNPLFPQTGATASYGWEGELARMGSGPVIGTAGRLVAVKDQETLLRAFALLAQSRPLRLVIFGEGPLEGRLRQVARDLGVADRVLFAGYVNDPAACYRHLDLFVLSSRSEGFGNVLVEAMAAGVPVVSTDAPYGPREILQDGLLGALVQVGDAGALATAMGDSLDHPVSAARLKARAADFTLDKAADRYEALLS